ncbi:uncharacterized protein A1O9_09295 [Exophiala aquamarina CBS 119918]|uniref:Carrier domain-containing protein n=1 Tax=Exophiala aquamarina CBS 119918 TaxID=1182545 RepID=A0A072P570_9EURO|nr:uncharacterized protein A1O9_09295 [Exophiala aquamarina CBS 119918]KEF54852.1 hypothetical protein A1O9_09295 [Exophiala aquamarina CBS 119918]
MSLEGLDISHPVTVSGKHFHQVVRVPAVASSSFDWTVQISGNSKDHLNQALSAIAKETGHSIGNMKDKTVLEDMGVDSVMSVATLDATIETIKKKSSSSITLPATVFSVHPTAGAMRTALDDMVEFEAPKSSQIVRLDDRHSRHQQRS